MMGVGEGQGKSYKLSSHVPSRAKRLATRQPHMISQPHSIEKRSTAKPAKANEHSCIKFADGSDAMTWVGHGRVYKEHGRPNTGKDFKVNRNALDLLLLLRRQYHGPAVFSTLAR